MISQTERDDIKRKGLNIYNYCQWFGIIRAKGKADGLGLNQIKERFYKCHIITEMFNDKVSPKNAYDRIMNMSNKERLAWLRIDILEQKDLIINLVNSMLYGDVKTCIKVCTVSRTLSFYQKEYKRLYRS